MTSLNFDILLEMAKKLLDSFYPDDVEKFALSGKEPLQSIQTVLRMMKYIKFEDGIIKIGIDSFQHIQFDEASAIGQIIIREIWTIDNSIKHAQISNSDAFYRCPSVKHLAICPYGWNGYQILKDYCAAIDEAEPLSPNIKHIPKIEVFPVFGRFSTADENEFAAIVDMFESIDTIVITPIKLSQNNPWNGACEDIQSLLELLKKVKKPRKIVYQFYFRSDNIRKLMSKFADFKVTKHLPSSSKAQYSFKKIISSATGEEKEFEVVKFKRELHESLF